jgi:hypothetical protein
MGCPAAISRGFAGPRLVDYSMAKTRMPTTPATTALTDHEWIETAAFLALTLGCGLALALATACTIVLLLLHTWGASGVYSVEPAMTIELWI